MTEPNIRQTMPQMCNVIGHRPTKFYWLFYRYGLLWSLLIGLLPINFASAGDCLLGGQAAPFSDASYCCSRHLQSNGLGICTDVPACLPGGAPADLSLPGACCSKLALINGGNPICATASTCMSGGHPADLNNPGACCSQLALINGDNPICQPETTNAYAVGTAFLDFNKNKQQDAGEKGSNIQDGALSVYAVEPTGHIVGGSFVESDGYWRIEHGLDPDSDYTFVLSRLANLQNGTLSPPPLLPTGFSTTGENRSFDYQSTGLIDGVSDGRVTERSTPGEAINPLIYINFGATDRIFASSFN
jgi:hypothetical protein